MVSAIGRHTRQKQRKAAAKERRRWHRDGKKIVFPKGLDQRKGARP